MNRLAARRVDSSAGARAAFTTLLTAGMAMGTLIAFAVGPLAPFLLREFGLSRAAIGLLTTVFYAVGAVGSPLVGPWADRRGGRGLLVALFGIAALALTGMAAAPTFAVLVAAVAVGGLANAAVNPVTNQLVSVHVASGQRGGVIGIKQSGVQFGALYAGTALPPLALALGWRGALLVTAGLAVGWAAATLPVVPHASAPTQSATVDGDGGRAERRLFVWWMSAYALLMGAGFSAVAAYLPLYAFEVVGYSEAVAGATAGLMGGTGVIARIAWGRLAERAPSGPRPLALLGGGAFLAMLAVWGAAAAAPLVWLGAVGIGATAAAWNAVGMLAIVREMPPSATGTVSGTVQLSFYTGFVVLPLAFGGLADWTGAYHAGWAIVTTLFVGAAAVAVAWTRARARGPAA